jgi:hypothetical protein
MLCLIDTVKEMQAQLSKCMNNLKPDLEGFNVKLVICQGNYVRIWQLIIVKWNNILIRQIR